jgi:hypothetical protein
MTTPAAAPARISFRQPVTELGYVDAGWWPRSRELRAELPSLLDVLWTACRDVNRVSYGMPFWEPVPRRMRVEDRVVSLRGIRGQDPSLLTLFDSAGRDHVDILVVPPEADATFAERVLELAGGMGSLEIGRLSDEGRTRCRVELVRGVHHPRHRLEAGEMTERRLRPPASLFLGLTCGRVGGIFARIDYAARQLPTERVRNEPMPPNHEHPVLVVEHGGQGDRLQTHDVMPESAAVGRLNLDLDEAHPLVVVNGALAVDLRAGRAVRLVHHAYATRR